MTAGRQSDLNQIALSLGKLRFANSALEQDASNGKHGPGAPERSLLMRIFPKLQKALGKTRLINLYHQERSKHTSFQALAKSIPEQVMKECYSPQERHLWQLAQLEFLLYDLESVEFCSPLPVEFGLSLFKSPNRQNIIYYLNPSFRLLESDGKLWDYWKNPNSRWEFCDASQWIGIYKQQRTQVLKLDPKLGRLLSHQIIGNYQDSTALAIRDLGSVLAKESVFDGLVQGWLHCQLRPELA